MPQSPYTSTAYSSTGAPCRPPHTGNSSAGALCRPPRTAYSSTEAPCPPPRTDNCSTEAPRPPPHTGNSSAGALCRPTRNPTNSALDLDLPSARHSASCPPMQQFCGRSRRLRAATGTWSGCRQADRLKTPVLGLRTLQPYAPAAF